MNALILAAGLGTRLGPYTSDRPKALVEVNGRPMLWWQLHKLAAQGFDRFIVNVHHFAPMVIDYLQANRNFGLDIRISNESDLLLDTGGGIRQAMHMLDNQDPLLVHNVDIFSNANAAALYRAHTGSGDYADSGCHTSSNGHTVSDCHAVSCCHATLLTASRDTSRYLYFDNSNILHGWSNVKTGQQRSPYTGFTPKDFTPRAFQGIHVLSQEILPYLDKVTEPAFSITDFYIDNCRTLKIQGLETVPAWKPSSELEPQSDKDIQSGKELQSLQWADAGRPETLSRAAAITALYKIS